MANENVLEGIRCPKCGHEDDFRISITMYAEAVITDNGYDLNDVKNYHTDWDNASSCKCLNCGFDGFVGDFQIDAGEEEDLRLIRKFNDDEGV